MKQINQTPIKEGIKTSTISRKSSGPTHKHLLGHLDILSLLPHVYTVSTSLRLCPASYPTYTFHGHSVPCTPQLDIWSHIHFSQLSRLTYTSISVMWSHIHLSLHRVNPHTSLGHLVHHTPISVIWIHKHLSKPFESSYTSLRHLSPHTHISVISSQTPFSTVRAYIHLHLTFGPTGTSLNYVDHACTSLFNQILHAPLSAIKSCMHLSLGRHIHMLYKVHAHPTFIGRPVP
jgi:hypothetical protein